MGSVIKVRIIFMEPVLGTATSDAEIYKRFIGSKAPDAASLEEEVAALGAEEVAERGRTVFPRDEKGCPFLWDYQVKGYLKEACKSLKAVPGTLSSKERAYRKKIDGLIFIEPRRIPFVLPAGAETFDLERPLRASTPAGERVALASSEALPAGTAAEFAIRILDPKDAELVRELMDYGALRGMLQWRNGGYGTFSWEEVG